MEIKIVCYVWTPRFDIVKEFIFRIKEVDLGTLTLFPPSLSWKLSYQTTHKKNSKISVELRKI